MGEINFKLVLITSSVVNITFVATKIILSVADISLLVTKTTFVLGEIFFKVAVITTFKDVAFNSSVVKIAFALAVISHSA